MMAAMPELSRRALLRLGVGAAAGAAALRSGAACVRGPHIYRRLVHFDGPRRCLDQLGDRPPARPDRARCARSSPCTARAQMLRV